MVERSLLTQAIDLLCLVERSSDPDYPSQSRIIRRCIADLADIETEMRNKQ